MRNIPPIHWLFGIIIVCFCETPAFSQTDNILVAEADPWCPYNCHPDDALPGFAVELLQASMALSGRSFIYRIAPWQRAIDNIRKGKIAAVIGPSRDSVVGQGLIFPRESIGRASPVMVVLATNKWQFNGVISLQELIIGFGEDYSYGKEIDEFLEKNHKNTDRLQPLRLIGGDVSAQNIRKLVAGRLTGVLDYKQVIKFTLRTVSTDEALRIVTLYPGDLSYVAFSPALPDGPRYAAEFDEGIAQLRASGAFIEILSKYGVEPWDERGDALPSR